MAPAWLQLDRCGDPHGFISMHTLHVPVAVCSLCAWLAVQAGRRGKRNSGGLPVGQLDANRGVLATCAADTLTLSHCRRRASGSTHGSQLKGHPVLLLLPSPPQANS